MDMPVQTALGVQGQAGPGPTRALAAFVADLRHGEIDAFARRAACRHLIDTLGAMIAGAAQDSTRSVQQAYARAGVAPGPVAMPGFTERFDALHAAYVGGTACHGLEVDDGYRLPPARCIRAPWSSPPRWRWPSAPMPRARR